MSQRDCSSDSSQSIQSFAPSPIISSTLYTRSPISQIYVLACQAWQPSSARSRQLNWTAVSRSLRRRVYKTVKRPSVDPSVCPIDRRRRAASLLLSAPQFSSVQLGGCEPSVTTATDVVHYTHSCDQHHIMPTNVHTVLFRITYIHTQVHPINGPLSRTTQVSRYQKSDTNLDFTEARDSEWQRHQLGYIQVCTSPQRDNRASNQPLSFFTGWMPFLSPNQQRQSTEGTCIVLNNSIRNQLT